MGFEIPVNTGEFGEVWLKGCDDGCVEMCTMNNVTANPAKGIEGGTKLVPFKYYANIEMAFQRVMQMRVGSAKAATLKELVAEIRGIRADIKSELTSAI